MPTPAKPTQPLPKAVEAATDTPRHVDGASTDTATHGKHMGLDRSQASAVTATPAAPATPADAPATTDAATQVTFGARDSDAPLPSPPALSAT